MIVRFDLQFPSRHISLPGASSPCIERSMEDLVSYLSIQGEEAPGRLICQTLSSTINPMMINYKDLCIKRDIG